MPIDGDVAVKVALVGLGNIAWKYDANKPDSPFALSQAGAMAGHAGLCLVGGCSPDADDRDSFVAWPGTRGECRAFATPEEMLS